MSRYIPQADPRSEYLAVRTEIDMAMRSVLEQGRYILGGEVDAFEKEFAAYHQVEHAIGVASGTDALFLALSACGVLPGDEVLTVSHTAVATIAAIERCGARPVLVDVDPESYTMQVDHLIGRITSRTKAVVPVHLYGQPANMPAILDLARQKGLRVIEDCAQAHGAQLRASPDSAWRPVGTFGDAAAFSFYPTKNLGAFGDGGGVVTQNAEVAQRVRLLREYGWRERYISDSPGWNSRLDELQAAILRVKLRYLDDWNNKRRALASIYDRGLADVSVVTPQQFPDRRHVFHHYVIRVPNREPLRQQLAQAGIATAVHYPLPVHRQPAYQALQEDAFLEVTDQLAPEILSLPMYPHLEAESARRTVQVLAELLPRKTQR